jgi:ADP-heptose:LPS heptosyltransferase
MNPKRIIISRTDSIGDVILTLPLAGILKHHFPDLHLMFLGSAYTKAVIDCCKHIDEFIDWTYIKTLKEDEAVSFLKTKKADSIIHVFPLKEIAILAKKAGIPSRIGTTNRIYHWYTCNKLLRFSRKNSDLHEAQLNTKLLKPFGINRPYETEELISFYGFESRIPITDTISSLIDKEKFNLILHPKSKGSAREWGPDNFAALIETLPKDKFRIFVSGTASEAQLMQTELLDKYKDSITDITGKFSLSEFISFISQSDGLIAASTGPLHIAAALGKIALGIYPPIKPMHPGRWKPLGEKASFAVAEKQCSACRKSNECKCMKDITPDIVNYKLEQLMNL